LAIRNIKYKLRGKKMKQKKEKKLRLDKETIQNLDIVLDKDDQERVKGGTNNGYPGTTDVPVHC
jgi:hypothetical protein